jgi:branched-chain amino acid transport system permease protein
MSAIKLAGTVAAGAAAFAAPYAVGGSALVFNTVVVIAIFAVMAYGVDIILSDLGEVSLAHTVFFAAGAYAVGVLSRDAGASSWTTLAAAIGLSAAVAAILGLVTYRLQGFVFSLVTYAAGVVCLNIAHNWAFLGGSDGLVGLPMLDLSIGPLILKAGSSREVWPYAFALLALTLWFVASFRKSVIGRSAHMIQQNERLATMSGVAPRRIRFRVLLISAVITGLAGWLYAYQRAYVGPDLIEPYFLILTLTAVVLPGKRVLLGPLVGTAILMSQKAFFSFGGYFDKLMLGTILVLVLAVYPAGLVGLAKALAGLFRTLRRKPADPSNPLASAHAGDLPAEPWRNE